jgi:hypothetical protein
LQPAVFWAARGRAAAIRNIPRKDRARIFGVRRIGFSRKNFFAIFYHRVHLSAAGTLRR